MPLSGHGGGGRAKGQRGIRVLGSGFGGLCAREGERVDGSLRDLDLGRSGSGFLLSLKRENLVGVVRYLTALLIPGQSGVTGV